MRKLALRDPSNPYAHFSIEDLHSALSRTRLWRRPGKVRYSTFGGGLLGHALARRAGLSYEQLIAERICRPLGMGDTGIEVPAAKQQRLAQGHSASGAPVPLWDIPALAGAGALRSTANDLLRFLRANLGPPETRLGRSAEVSKTMAVGLAWQLWGLGASSPLTLAWHNGATGGFGSFVGVLRPARSATVVLANSNHSVDSLGMRIAEALSEDSALGANAPAELNG